jgi:hypothetical protein
MKTFKPKASKRFSDAAWRGHSYKKPSKNKPFKVVKEEAKAKTDNE